MVKLKTKEKISFLVLILLNLLPCALSAQANAPMKPFSQITETKDYALIQGGGQMLQSSTTNSTSFSRHIMCKDHDLYYDPINPTTIFRPSDKKAECLTTVTVNETIEFRWFYRSDSKAWVSCYDWSTHALFVGEYYYEGHLNIAGYWPGTYYPKAYKVEVYLDGSYAFSDFFEVTNGGLNSPRICENIDAFDHPVNVKSMFIIGEDTKASYYLGFDKVAYFNEELKFCHNFTTVWIQPNGSTYKKHSGSFRDYKDSNATLDYWTYLCDPNDYVLINSTTPIGNWKVELYLDNYYFNGTWMSYGPVATTPFIVENEPVADWTFMVYIDGDNTLETAGIEVFLKMANIGASSKVNIVAQMDRSAGWEDGGWYDDTRFGNWTDCKRFNVTKNMAPTPENAIQDLGEVDMADPNTLKDFVNWSINNYSAKYYALVLWDHGAGCMGFCFDVTNGTDFLSLPEFSQALTGLPATMDVVIMDACSMNMAEVAYQIKDYANVLIGPEGLGYAPAPYDYYLTSLTTNPSMSPNTFATKITADYLDWSISFVGAQNSTISAIDLTRMSSLMTAIEDFALKLKDQETLCHKNISQARNLCRQFPGPYAGQAGYYIDLYNFAQLIYQNVLDKEVQNVAAQITTILSIGGVTIDSKQFNISDSHGLSIFFPDEKVKYESFESLYQKTAFAIDTTWEEFVKYHLSGYVLTIKTPYSAVTVEIDKDSYTTDTDGKIQVFVLPDYHTINITATVSSGAESRGIFTQWNDSDVSNPKTFLVNGEVTLEAKYQTQYLLVIGTDPSGLNPQPQVSVAGPWYNNHTLVRCTAQNVSGKVFDYWTVDGANTGIGINPIGVTMDGPREVIAHYAPALSWWERLLQSDTVPIILGFLGVALIATLVGFSFFRKKSVKEHAKPIGIEPPKVVLPGRISTGYEDLDGLLFGGIPEGYSVV